jgi:hypothetical protein
MDWSDDDENAYDSIRVNREFDWSVIDESDLQFEKHLEFDVDISMCRYANMVDSPVG